MAFNTDRRSDNNCSYGTVAVIVGAGQASGSALIKTGAGYLRGAVAYASNGAAIVPTITISDGLTTNHNKIVDAMYMNSAGGSLLLIDFGVDVPFTTGLYFASTGSCKATVFYY